MQPKRSKYDTNPLDGNVAEQADKDWGRETGSPVDAPTQAMSGGVTSEIGRTSNEAARINPEMEAPTRRMDDSYRSVFAYGQSQATYQPPRVPDANIYQPPPGPPPNIYQPPPMPVSQSPGSRKVPGVNISEKWANVLPYCPFFVGLIAGVVELLLVPRAERRTRFHAAQGFALQIALFVISSAFSVLQAITDSGIGSGLFKVAAFVFLIVSMVRVAKGRPHHIAPLDPATTWFEEKISPKK